MLFKTTLAAAAVATGLVALAPAQQAEAKTNFNIDIGVGLGGFYPGDGYYGGYYPRRHGISCNKGRNIVRWHGFNRVHAVDCGAPVYQYNARKNGRFYRVKVSSRGHVIDVRRISW